MASGHEDQRIIGTVAGRPVYLIAGADDDPQPSPFAELSVEELETQLAAAIASFDELRAAESVSEDDIAQMRALTEQIGAMRAEQTAREAAAQQAADEIDALAAQVHVPDPEAVEPEVVEPVEPEVINPEAVVEPEPVTVAASASRRLNIQAVRARQKQVAPPKDEKPTIEFVATGAVPGYSAGQSLSMQDAGVAIGETARALFRKTGTPSAQSKAVKYAIPFDDELQVNEIDEVEGTNVTAAAADQSRLPGGDLVASGGWCAPSETIYDIAGLACPDMLWNPPELQLMRGGVRVIPTPTLVVADLAWTHTEADDIAEETKPCFHVPCPDVREFRCEAKGVCIEAGLLTSRAFPELIERYVANAMVAHEINMRRNLFTAAVADELTVSVATDATFAGFTAVYGAVAFQAADFTEKHSLCESIALEVVFPWWARNLFLADIARQNGRAIDEIDPAVITRAFARLGVAVSFARGIPPQVPTDIGGSLPATGWPDEMSFLMSPAGHFQFGRGLVVDLGVVQDSAKFSVNDYTALFTEECITLVVRGAEARYITVPVCPDGTTGSQIANENVAECPIDGGTVTAS